MLTLADFTDPPHALLIIDVQQAIDAPYWGRRNNPGAEAAIAKILAAWRARQLPLIHVRHDSTHAESAYRPGHPGNQFKPCAAPLAGETVLAKSVHSAFIATGLEERLRRQGIAGLVVIGVITNNSVETTVRHGANLGFAVAVVADACFTFDKVDYRGRNVPAEHVHAISLANLQDEYARILDSTPLLAALA